MRQTLLFILFFTFQNSFGQFGIIRDKTGLVNVRKSPEISNNIIDTLHDGQVIFYYNEPKGEWYDVEYEKDHMTLSGFVHQSRFKFLTEFDSIPVKLRTKDKVIFQKGSFKITLTKVPFIAKNNKLQYSKEDEKSNTTSVLEKINHKKFGELTEKYRKLSMAKFLLNGEIKRLSCQKKALKICMSLILNINTHLFVLIKKIIQCTFMLLTAMVPEVMMFCGLLRMESTKADIFQTLTPEQRTTRRVFR